MDNDIRFDSEHLLLIKTLEGKYAELEEFMMQTHSYDVPEIIAVQSEKVAGGYLQWINESVNRKTPDQKVSNRSETKSVHSHKR